MLFCFPYPLLVAFSVDGSVDKLYVGCVNKQASKQEIEEIFSPYGLVEDVYIARDAMKQSRGCAFVKFLHREMALAAIKGLNGNFTMRGCDQPLVVRFADPKKPRAGDFRAPTNCGDFVGGNNLPNALFGTQDISANLQPQSVPHMAKHEHSAPHGTEQPCPPVNLLPQLSQMPQQCMQTTPMSSMPSQQQCMQTPPISSIPCQQQRVQTPLISSMPCQQAESEVQRQAQNLEQQQSTHMSPKSSWTGSNLRATNATSAASVITPYPQTEDLHECDWSEHTCPDGYKYYYNCITYESRWEKPEEFTLFQQFLQKQKMLDAPKLSSVFSAMEIDRSKKNLDHEQLQSESSLVVDPTCV
uniref:Flowering time control protein FCA n=1 Tax=Rhizophora mucronata TaxID=61149 RepID=A0A2P2LNE0_RHIMU